MTTGALKEEDCRLRAEKAYGIQDSGFGIQEKKSRLNVKKNGVISSGLSSS
jgi:hypothetical protein